MTTILILGAGIMQLPAIRISKRKGWRVIVADANPGAMARREADLFETVDLKDRDGLLALALAHREAGGLDGIFTAGTDFSSSVAWVAERAGLPGISFEAASRATDKCLMRAAFAASGVPSPRFACWTGASPAVALLRDGLSFPLVVKPVDNMGSRGVKRVQDAASLEAACLSARALSRSSRVIVEEFMEGPELSLDAVVSQGEITVCGVADRHIFFPPSFVEMGHTMPTALDPHTVEDIEGVFRAGIRAIGIDNGAAKGDIKLTRQGPMVGEIAARLSGGYMSGWTFPLATGVEVTEAALNIAVGLPPGNLAPTLRRTCAERALISVPGIVAEITGAEAARALPGVREVFLRVGPGQEVVFPENNVQKCGNVIAVGESREEAIASAQRAQASIVIRLRPLVDVTDTWLFEASAHDAYAGVSPAVRTAAFRMPLYSGDPAAVRGRDELVVLPLGEAGEERGTDWYGAGIPSAASAALLAGHAGIAANRIPGGFALGGMFWRALLRGSTQAALYALDSVHTAAEQGWLREYLARL